MKLRLALVSAILLLGLVSCSLAEDITPPADYVAPITISTNTPVPPTSTPVPPTATEIVPTSTAADSSVASVSTDAAGTATTPDAASTDTIAVTPEASATEGIQTGTVNGKVLNGSGSSMSDGLTVTLRGFDMPTDNSGSYTEAVNQSLPLATDGLYEFTNVEMPNGRIFLIEVEYNGVPYQSDYLAAEQASMTLPDLTVYDTTTDYTTLSLDQVHIALDYSTADTVQIIEMYILTNNTKQTVAITTDGTSIPFVKIPDGATNLNFQVASGSASFLGTPDGFALAPSVNGEQYGLVAVFDLPYAKKISLNVPFALSVSTVSFFVPEGVKLTGDQITDQGVQDFSGTSYQTYEATDIAADSSLSLKITGKPATASTSTTGTTGGITNQQWLIIGLGALGMALIGIGLFFFIRDRRLSRIEDEEDEEGEEGVEGETGEVGEKTGGTEPTDALGEDRDAILDAILALDDQFKAGEIAKEVYETRRNELKERLKKLG
jgi:hypothetical protein